MQIAETIGKREDGIEAHNMNIIWTDIALLITYGLVAICGIWLFANRENYRKWFYLAYALAFICLALGIWPGYEVMTITGYIILIVNTGLQLFSNVIVEGHEKHGMDIRAGKLMPHD